MLKTGGVLKAELDKITTEFGAGADSLASKINAATTTAALDFSQAYTKFSDAINNSVGIIDKALESNDLTELDTTNLKSLKSYLNETLTTFDNAVKESGLKSNGNNEQKDLTQEKIDKLKSGLNSAIELGKTAEEKLQQQPETATSSNINVSLIFLNIIALSKTLLVLFCSV